MQSLKVKLCKQVEDISCITEIEAYEIIYELNVNDIHCNICIFVYNGIEIYIYILPF